MRPRKNSSLKRVGSCQAVLYIALYSDLRFLQLSFLSHLYDSLPDWKIFKLIKISEIIQFTQFPEH